MNVDLPGALQKLVIARCFNSWYGLAGLTPMETKSLCLVSNKKLQAVSLQRILPVCLSHVEEEDKKKQFSGKSQS